MWALWALANLTTTDGEKYCAFIEREGGVPLLHALRANPNATKYVLTLTDRILRNLETGAHSNLE